MTSYEKESNTKKIETENEIDLVKSMVAIENPPELLDDFAFVHDDKYRVLMEMAENENWDCGVEPPYPGVDKFPLLIHYIRNTYRSVLAQGKLFTSQNNSGLLQCCFDTGLLTRANFEPIYMLFTPNNKQDAKQKWYCNGSFPASKIAREFDPLPEMATYYDQPNRLIMNPDKPIIINYDHILEENFERLPKSVKDMEPYQRRCIFRGSVEMARERVRRNYQIAVPSYYLTRKVMQLLLPLCFDTPQKADLALTLEDNGSSYRAATCLELNQAIINARLVARPDLSWLAPASLSEHTEVTMPCAPINEVNPV